MSQTETMQPDKAARANRRFACFTFASVSRSRFCNSINAANNVPKAKTLLTASLELRKMLREATGQASFRRGVGFKCG
jgi:hypothetical protein